MSEEIKELNKDNNKSDEENNINEEEEYDIDSTNKEDKKQNDILKDEEEWVNVNVDELVDEFTMLYPKESYWELNIETGDK